MSIQEEKEKGGPSVSQTDIDASAPNLREIMPSQNIHIEANLSDKAHLSPEQSPRQAQSNRLRELSIVESDNSAHP